jgi:hypothetical protein
MTDIIDEILDVELKMFLALQPSNEAPCHVRCQDNPAAFRMVRRASFETWSQKTLASYYFDIHLASVSEPSQNVMFIKYGRMSGELPKQYDNDEKDATIERIIEIEKDWKETFAHEHPGVFRKDDGFSMRYLRGELETYSPSTVELYYQDRLQAQDDGRNLIEETHHNLETAMKRPYLERMVTLLRQFSDK